MINYFLDKRINHVNSALDDESRVKDFKTHKEAIEFIKKDKNGWFVAYVEGDDKRRNPPEGKILHTAYFIDPYFVPQKVAALRQYRNKKE